MKLSLSHHHLLVSPLADGRVRGLMWLWCGIYSLLSCHGLFCLINCILRSPCPSLGLIYWIVVTVTDIAQSSLRFVRDLRLSCFIRVPVLVLRGNIVHSPPITRSALNTVGSCSFVRSRVFIRTRSVRTSLAARHWFFICVFLNIVLYVNRSVPE